MKKRLLLKYIIKIKMYLQNIFNAKQNTVVTDRENLIIELIFKDVTTRESIMLFKAVSKNFQKQLSIKEKNALNEIDLISEFNNNQNI